MLLIATDEAGYGPKLGPLVIVGTAWRIPGDDFLGSEDLASRFAPLRAAHCCGDEAVVVDDSKTVYSSATNRTSDQGGRIKQLAPLHAAVSASLHWCGRSEQTLSQWLPHLSPQDMSAIGRAPWLDELDETLFLDSAATSVLLERWRESEIALTDIQARIMTAEAFNAGCRRGNKADLLSESTLGLVRRLLELQGGEDTSVAVYCDRHGGRRYYASVVQHVFPDAQLQVIDESKQQSVYRLVQDETRIDLHFTVKGDSFTPVALSSMQAKYLRERFMDSFNAFFAARHGQGAPLRPTAGYPVDADRFLTDIEAVIKRERIELDRLVRSR